MPEILNQRTFEKKVDVKRPVLVEFFATWCSHCHRMQPLTNQLADEMAQTVAVYQVDIDQSPQLAQLYASQGVPTFVLFNNGVPVNMLVGEQTMAALRMLASPHAA